MLIVVLLIVVLLILVLVLVLIVVLLILVLIVVLIVVLIIVLVVILIVILHCFVLLFVIWNYKDSMRQKSGFIRLFFALCLFLQMIRKRKQQRDKRENCRQRDRNTDPPQPRILQAQKNFEYLSDGGKGE